MTKTTKIIRLAAVCLVLVHLLTLSCFASESNGFEGVQTWTEGSLTPLVREDTENAMTITSANAPCDWWKVKLELPRSVEQGKTYETKFVFTSNVTGTIKYVVDGANYLTSNEYNVQNGENIFTIRFTAGAETYNCLELGGLGAFTLTFTEISVTAEGAQEEPGEHTHSYENGKCSCGLENAFVGIQTWTEGSLTPVTREDTENTMTVISANAAGDWWKVKLELPRSVEQGKTYEATFVFTSDVAGTIKYHVGDAAFLTGNEFNVQPGENTFTVRFTAGADTYNCLELGGLGQFRLTFTGISVAEWEEPQQPEEPEVPEVPEEPETPVEPENPVPGTGDATNVILWSVLMLTAAMAVCVLVRKEKTAA